MKSKIIVGTRGSKLALIQTNMVIDALKKFYPALKAETKIIKTIGDKVLDKELSEIGGKGLFIKEIEEALSGGEVDFAVHSLKDIPHTLPAGFRIAAVLKREDPRDVLICKNSYDLNTLPFGSKVGTGSLRRKLQLKTLRPNLEFLSIRGNIDTRITKLARGDFDAIILAAAGLKRMGWQDKDDSSFLKALLKEDYDAALNISYLNMENFIPAVGQGALAIEIRENDTEISGIVKVLNHKTSADCVFAERAFLKFVDGGCKIPVGAYCKADNDTITISGFVGNEETSSIYREELTGNIKDYEILGIQLAKKVLDQKKNDKLNG